MTTPAAADGEAVTLELIESGFRAGYREALDDVIAALDSDRLAMFSLDRQSMVVQALTALAGEFTDVVRSFRWPLNDKRCRCAAEAITRNHPANQRGGE